MATSTKTDTETAEAPETKRRQAVYLRQGHNAKGETFEVTEKDGLVVAKSTKHTWHGTKQDFKLNFDPV